MERTYAVKTPSGLIARINTALGIAVVTSDLSRVKRFRTEVAAFHFIRTYGDAGYGLVVATASVVPHPLS